MKPKRPKKKRPVRRKVPPAISTETNCQQPWELALDSIRKVNEFKFLWLLMNHKLSPNGCPLGL